MVYRCFAWIVWGLHWIFSVWLFGGALVVAFIPMYAPYHALVVFIALALQLVFKRTCFMTGLEKAMWKKGAPERVYEGAFLRHYTEKYFGWKIPMKRTGQVLVLIFFWSLFWWTAHALIKFLFG